MRLLIQRASRASVSVDGGVVSSIGNGLVILVGVGDGDDAGQIEALAEKVVGLRIFRDEGGETNLAIGDVGGEALVISQFTLYADTSKGRRPSFIRAADPALAEQLVEAFAKAVETRGVPVGRGVFGAEMEVELVNDGPFTMWLEVEPS
jgi:D-aminoacyl-tRNA deacylase